jgi:hypothetical protein
VRKRVRRALAAEPLEARSLLSTLSVPAAADAFVRGGSYASANYGANKQLWVSNVANASSDRQTFLRFDLSGVPGTVRRATLRLVPSSLGANVAATTYRVSLVGDTADT